MLQTCMYATPAKGVRYLITHLQIILTFVILTVRSFISETDDYFKGYMLKIMKDCEYADTLLVKKVFSLLQSV